MTAQWDDDVHHALHVALTGERHGYYADFAGGDGRDEAGPLAVLAKVLTRGFLHDGTMSTFRGRPWGRPVDAERLDARRLLGYLQTHDQVGNRMAGDRVSATLAAGPAGRRAPRSTCSPRPPPMVFMGEEWAASTPWQFFTSFDEDGLAEAVRAGRRAEFGSHGWSADAVPDPQDPATRDRVGAATGTSATRSPTPRCCAGTPRAPRCAASWSAPARPGFADVARGLRRGRPLARRAPRARRPARHPPSSSTSVTHEQEVPVGGDASSDVLLAWDPAGTTLLDGAVRLPGGSVAVVRVG